MKHSIDPIRHPSRDGSPGKLFIALAWIIIVQDMVMIPISLTMLWTLRTPPSTVKQRVDELHNKIDVISEQMRLSIEKG